VCFAEVIAAPNLTDAMLRAQDCLNAHPSYAWFEMWLDGERVASSHDTDTRAKPASKARGLLN
jgi:hypothetical protein